MKTLLYLYFHYYFLNGRGRFYAELRHVAVLRIENGKISVTQQELLGFDIGFFIKGGVFLCIIGRFLFQILQWHGANLLFSAYEILDVDVFPMSLIPQFILLLCLIFRNDGPDPRTYFVNPI